VTWGDGSTATTGLSVTGSNGNYAVSGSHLYAEEGSYSFSITVADEGGQDAGHRHPYRIAAVHHGELAIARQGLGRRLRMQQSAASFRATNILFSPAGPALGVRPGIRPAPGHRRNRFAAKRSGREGHFASVVIGGTRAAPTGGSGTSGPALFDLTSFFHNDSWRNVFSWERFLA
jgi:hypothetical protein